MVRFLTTTGISHQLEELVKSAQRELTLVSPYVKINQRLLDFIKDSNQRGVKLTLVYGKRNLSDAEKEWVGQLTAFETGFVENLHAKCYLNETTAIITSMNLYEFSQQNNDEMGIRVDSKEDPQLYQEIKTEAERLLRKATDRQSKGTTQAASIGIVKETNGFCIRCRDVIHLSQAEPLCGNCYRSWARYQKEDYEEKFCHSCGEDNSTTKAKPFCYRCYRQITGV